jgi:hypothetical protein
MPIRQRAAITELNYRTTFDLSGFAVNQADIKMRVLADDTVTAVLASRNAIGSISRYNVNFRQWTGIPIPASSLAGGTNTIEISLAIALTPLADAACEAHSRVHEAGCG